MEEWLAVVTKYAVLVIDAMALAVIAIGSVEAFLAGLRTMLVQSATKHEGRKVWLRYARRPVAGLTFQRAADVIQTSITPTRQELGLLAAAAVIRTFPDFFLERDLAEVRQWQRETKPQGFTVKVRAGRRSVRPGKSPIEGGANA
jgi:uncharacterized membrane protein